MQVYTKILIGMVVGVVVGFTLGPKSPLLDHDLYQVPDASAADLRIEPGAEKTLPFPAVPIEVRAASVSTRTATDESGVEHVLPAWVRGEVEYTKGLSLRDKDGALRRALGGVSVGQSAWVHLQVPSRALPGGKGFLVELEPVSAIGDAVISALRPIGALFMRLIKMVIVPLVFASLLVGVASLGDLRKLGRMGAKTLGLYFMTTAIAVSIGLACAAIIDPGSYIGEADAAALQSAFTGQADSKADAAAKAPSTVDNILSIVPTNPIESMVSGNMLQIIFFAVIFGIALTMMGAGESKIIITFFDKVQQAMVLIIHMVMELAPYGVAALLAEVIGSSGLSVLASLVVYGLTVLLGLALHASLVYGGLVTRVAKVPLIPFLKGIRPAQMVAFSTSSSSATLPVSMEVAETNLRVSNSTASFVLPLGATVNMDGTALYQGVAAVFIAQAFQMDLSFVDQLTIVLTATAASIGAAGVPGAGMITLAMVLTATGIPVVGVALILGMDRILDMFRTAVNVTGDLAVTTVIAVSEGEDVRPLTPEEDAADPDAGFEGRLAHDPEPVEPD